MIMDYPYRREAVRACVAATFAYVAGCKRLGRDYVSSAVMVMTFRGGETVWNGAWPTTPRRLVRSQAASNGANLAQGPRSP